MSVIQRKPFIEDVVNTLGDLKSDLLDLVNGSEKTPAFRSLINANAKVTGADKNKVQYVTLETWSKVYTGYLIYNNSYCVLVAFTSNTQALVMLDINVTKQTFEIVKEPLDINEFRRLLEEADEHITTGEIDSGSATEGQVLAADGDGGASWENVPDLITEANVTEGDAVKLFGFDSQGNLVADDLPEGILVDNSVIEDSPNAVSGGAVYDELADIKEDITDINGELETKANVDGNYPTMTVGVADQLSPYDEDSGDDQDEPFDFQATGTGNGTQEDFSTGAIALMKEKQGNTVVVNQKIYSNITQTFTTTAETPTGWLPDEFNVVWRAYADSLINGHKYIGIMQSSSASLRVDNGKQGRSGIGIITMDTNDYGTAFYVNVLSALPAGTYTVSYMLIDLTQWFNGDIPSDLLSHPENFFRYYQGSLAYNEGELVNANGRYIKCIGRNQWDEEWELGYYNTNTGESVGSNSNIRCKNYIRVNPNTSYYCRFGGNGNIWALFYDKDYNLVISTNENVQARSIYQNAFQIENSTFNIPANAQYIRFYATGTYGTTYNNDITVSLYYSGESGYDQYYPYEVLTNNDTGTEVLRKAGNVCDIKLPDGTIKRNVGYVDLGTLNWSVGDYGWYSNDLTLSKNGEYDIKPNFTCDKYEVVRSRPATRLVEGTICGNADNKRIWVNNGSTTTEPTGTLYYELATPTTEQGTAFSENLVIDDFGSMDFQGTNGVPQGNLIFYPVDYKAFIDTLYNYTEGTPSNIALKSELSADKSELQGVDTQLLNAIGGTLRHCLAIQESGLDFEDTDFVDLGSLSWTYDSTYTRFSATIPTAVAPTDYDAQPKILCTKYERHAPSGATDKQVFLPQASGGTTTTLFVKDSSYTDATVFKNAMKGVLLAYEKASS